MSNITMDPVKVAEDIRPFVEDDIELYHLHELTAERLSDSIRNQVWFKVGGDVTNHEGLKQVGQYFNLDEADLQLLFPTA